MSWWSQARRSTACQEIEVAKSFKKFNKVDKSLGPSKKSSLPWWLDWVSSEAQTGAGYGAAQSRGLELAVWP
jgi:hypothetical protein